MNSSAHARNSQASDRTGDFQILNSAIASFNVTALELEQSYRLLHEQVCKLNREVEEKNKLLERNLKEKERVEQFLSCILDSLPAGVIVTDHRDRLLLSNSAVEKITGSIPQALHPDAFRQWLETIKTPLNCDSDGISNRDIDYCRENADMRNLKIIQSPVADTTGRSTGVLYILQDQTRLKKLEGQSERDLRLKAMGEMAIKIAHEVRNPLGSIELFASILRRELDDQQDLQKMADRIITEVKSLDNAISNLLLFTRPQQPHVNALNLSDVVQEFVGFIEPIVSKNDVTLTYESCAPHVIAGDRDLLKQVFLNLTLNALQAMPEGGLIDISLRSYWDETPQSKWVEIVFRDAGSGIPKESLNKIFNPFFTTREKGTGLGLAIVHNIIESHKGTIEVRSEVARGTSFTISFPGVCSDKSRL